MSIAYRPSLVHRSTSKVNHSGADTQVIPCPLFHPIVEQLTVFYISRFVF